MPTSTLSFLTCDTQTNANKIMSHDATPRPCLYVFLVLCSPQWCTHLPDPIYLVQRLTLGVLVAQGSCPHVTEPQGALAAAVDEEVAVVRMELGCCDHLREVLHVGWLDVYDVWIDEVKGNSDGALALSFP